MKYNEDIQLCSNETLRMILDHQRKQNENFRKLAYTCLISSMIVIFSVIGVLFYWFSTIEAITEKVATTSVQVIEGESIKIAGGN